MRYRYFVSIPIKENGRIIDADMCNFHHRHDAEHYIRGRLYVLPDDTIATLTDRYSHRDKLRVTAYRYSPSVNDVVIDMDYCD